MMARRTLLVCACWALAVPIARADSLEDVLTRMDRFAKDFKSFAAKMTRTDYQKLLDETTPMEGVVRDAADQGRHHRCDGVFRSRCSDRLLRWPRRHRYFPKANTEEVYEIGKKGASLEQIILLGFGTSRTELSKGYDIALGGPDTVGGMPVTRIELTPKSKDQKSIVARIELWIPMDKGYPIQEKITEPTKNYQQVTYSDMKVPAPANSVFKPVVPADVHKIYPQK